MKIQDLLEDGAIGRHIVAVDDHMRTENHELAPLAPIILQSGPIHPSSK
jgi:hypothetical protein